MAEPKKRGVVPASWGADLLAGIDAPRAAAPPLRAPGAVRPSSPDLVLVRRILAARAPNALAELETGLVEASRGEPALVAWLARPVDSGAEDLDADPLDVLRGNLAQIARSLKQLPPGSKVNASVYNSITTAVKAIEGIMSKRPREPTKDEIAERIAGAAAEARAKIVEYTKEAREKLEADRAAFVAWLRANLGPRLAEEGEARVAAMLGDA
mgnify:FL=1